MGAILPLLKDALIDAGVKPEEVLAALRQHLEVVDALTAEADPMGEPFEYLELSDHRDTVRAFMDQLTLELYS